MSERMPAIFFGHGNPMNALADNVFTQAWSEIGRNIPKPRSILCISAHWCIPTVAVTAMGRPRTIHDFGGFPRELYEVEYPAHGSRELAERVEAIVEDLILDDEKWGLDHGTWSVLCHVFPDADVPVVQLSINENEPGESHYRLGRMLMPLRDEGVLVIGSGNIVHNLHAYAWGSHDVVEPFDWALRFESKARELMLEGDHAPLVDYETLGPDAMLSAPTPDHYLPLLYILGLQREDDKVTFPVEGFDGGSISMLSVMIG